ncbi:MAG TPA: NAD(P)/FAD-dependent oxidoreductase [Planctomycetia bacterium]|nr:NAD(P)/FAD-dependent oxidoreductase [Planctomycetia bacterium]
MTETNANSRYDAAVVGAGPAGSVVAGLLARDGLSVLLVDRSEFPRPKVCGGCLNRRALAALAAAGLGDIPEKLGGVPLEQVRLAASGREALLPLEGVSVSRSAFDAALVDAAIRRGANFRPGTVATPARGDDARGDRRLVELRNANGIETIEAGIVIAADGLGGRFSGEPAPPANDSRIGAGAVTESSPFFEPGAVYMSVGRGGYVGLVRLEDGRLDVACAFDREATRQAGGPAELAAQLIQGAGWPEPPGLRDAPWRGTPPLTRQARATAAHRLFVAGDAAGYVEPFTGEGMAWAIGSAVALAEIAVRPWTPELAKLWSKTQRRLVVKRQFACRTLAAVLRRPRLAAAMVAVLRQWPGLASPVLRSLGKPAVIR